VPLVALAIPDELGQVQWQRPLRAEEPEEAHRHPRHAVGGVIDAGDVGDRKGELGLLRQAHGFGRRTTRRAQSRQPRTVRLYPPQRLIEIEALRHSPEGLEEHQATLRIPTRAGHLATSPRVSELSTV